MRKKRRKTEETVSRKRRRSLHRGTKKRQFHRWEETSRFYSAAAAAARARAGRALAGAAAARACRPSPRLLDASPNGHRVLRLVRPEPRHARPRCAFVCRCALARRPPRSLARVLVLVLRCRVRSPCAVCCLSRARVGRNERRQRETENERTEKGIREREKKKNNIYYAKTLALCEIFSIDDFFF